MELTPRELNRYQRTIVLPEVGAEGQTQLKKAAVLIVGAGGLGSPVGLYLAAAGVGTIGIIDGDLLEESNLQRQVLYTESAIGNSKADSAQKKLLALNSNINVVSYQIKVDNVQALKKIIKDYEIVVAAVDNYQTRVILNQACLEGKRLLVDAGVKGYEGYVVTFVPGETPCYQCVFSRPDPPETEPSNQLLAGILPTVPAVLGSLQANEVLKLLLKIGERLTGKMLVVDLLKLKFNKIEIKRRADCPACGINPK